MKLFKVYSATDGIYTIYAVSRAMLERSLSTHFEKDCEIKHETIGFSYEDIISLNKMHLLKKKTGYTESEVLDAISRTISSCEDNHFDELMNSATNEDKLIVETWFAD